MPLVSVSTWFVEKNKMNIAGILILKKKKKKKEMES